MIYLDNAATTKVDERLFPIMQKYLIDDYYNPSALYGPASNVKVALNNYRDNIKRIIGAQSNSKLIFTASGSESDNLALFGSLKKKNSTIIISEIEHSAVYNTAKQLENMGHKIVLCPVNEYGCVELETLNRLLDDSVELVSIMHISNETGVVNDIKALCGAVKKYNKNILFHSDGVQAFGKILVNVSDLGVDMYSISAHKIGGPKGIGALYIKNTLNIKPIIYGGGQEFAIRSATENMPYIAAMSEIATIKAKYNKIIEYNYIKVDKLKQYLIQKVQNELTECKIIFNKNYTFSPYILMFAIKSLRGEVMLHYLETKDILIGTGSACSSNKKTSRVQKALKMDSEHSSGIVRISLSIDNTIEEIDTLINEMKNANEMFSSYKRS